MAPRLLDDATPGTRRRRRPTRSPPPPGRAPSCEDHEVLLLAAAGYSGPEIALEAQAISSRHADTCRARADCGAIGRDGAAGALLTGALGPAEAGWL
jgi:hypothetical protein